METKDLHDKDISYISHYIKKYFNSIPDGDFAYNYAPKKDDIIKQIDMLKGHNTCIAYNSTKGSPMLVYFTEKKRLLFDNVFIKNLKYCVDKYQLTIIPFGIVSSGGNHFNILIVKDRVVYLFEPHFGTYREIIHVLKIFFEHQIGIRFRGIEFNTHVGLQSIETSYHEKKIDMDEGYCVAWGLLIVDLIQKFPHVKLYVLLYIIANVLEYDPKKFKIFIKKYAMWLDKKMGQEYHMSNADRIVYRQEQPNTDEYILQSIELE